MIAVNHPQVQAQIRNLTGAIIAKNLPQFQSRFTGSGIANIPEDQLAEFKRTCALQARNHVLQQMQQQGRLNQQFALQQQQAQAQRQAQQQQMVNGGGGGGGMMG